MKLIPYFLSFWYPLVPTTKMYPFLPSKAEIFSVPHVVYFKNHTNKYIAHSDICPHQGASLSAGKITKHDCFLQCPYHGFQFDEGMFCQIPNPRDSKVRPFQSRIQLPTLDTTKGSDFLFVRNASHHHNDTVYYPPEEYNASFRGVSGTIKISTNYLSICENLLDMLHISYVHTFGSVQNPLPTSMNFSWIGPFHGRSTFLYRPNENTISQKVGKVEQVKVENEFILPTNTITRVFAGDTIKTVFTRTIPVSDTESILYWKIYRNFWLSRWGDILIKHLMQQTVQEDIDILKKVYPKKRDGPLRTRYDRTIQEFRGLYKKYGL